MNDENNIYSEYQSQNDSINITNQVQNNINYVNNEDIDNISKIKRNNQPKGSMLPALFLIFIIVVVSYFLFFYNKDISLFDNKKMQLIINESMVLGDVSDISVLYNQQEISFDNLIWSSSNQRVLDIKNGKAIALKKGTSRVTAEMTNGEKISVLVEVNDDEILLEKFVLKGKNKINLGESFNFDIEFEPSNATNRDLEWQSGNTNIIDIVDGKVTAKGIGTATVIAKSSNGKTASMKITVVNNNVDLKSIEIIGKTTMYVGGIYNLNVIYSPSNATSKKIEWTCDKNDVLSIDQNGKVKALKKGMATITAKSNNGKISTLNITIKETNIVLKSISIQGKNEINIGNKINLLVSYDPENVPNKSIEWSSEDSNIASVDEDGKVTGVNVGTTKIIAKSSNGKIAKFEINVKKQEITNITILGNESVKVGNSLQLNVSSNLGSVNNNDIKWISSNPSVATVSNGEVTGVSEGTTTITATTSNGKSDSKVINVVNIVINVESISISGSNTVNKGSSITLTATVSPSNATNKTIEWTSSNPSVATVSNGKVTGVSAGTTTITATTSNGKKVSKTITVTNPTVEVTSVSISGSSTVNKGSSITLTATVSPTNATNKTIDWKSSNPLVATVSNGKVTGVSAGTTTITATTSNGKKASKTITVTNPTVEVTSVSISGSSTVNKGSSITLTATVSPSNATNKTIEWKSSNPSVATVSNGKVTGVSAGTTTITATTSNGKVATKSITVVNPTVEVTSVSISGSNTVNKGSSITLTATVSPSNATNKTIEWTSSNSSVATVSNGKVTGVSAGTTTITATTSNGKKASKTITVKDVVKVSMKIGTFNVARFRQNEWAWANMADMIKNNGLNIVGVQEGTAAEKISKYPSNFIKSFVNRTGLTNYVYLSNLDGNYINGNTILTQYTIQSSNNYLLTKCSESRALQKVVIKVNGVNISFYNTHFSYQKSSTEAKSCPIIHLKSALSYMKNDPNPAILTGDFNWDYSIINKYMDSNYTLYTTKCEPGRKCPSNRSGEDKMDLIYVKEKDSKGIKRIEKVNEEVIEASKYSDHNLIITTVNVIN